MALVNAISFTLEDYSGDRRSVRVYAPATASLPEMQNLSDAVAAELDAITGMVIVGATVSFALSLPVGLKSTATEDIDAERGINWSFAAAGTTYSFTVRTPGATNAIVDGEDVVTTADTNDWVTVMLDGDATTDPTNEHGGDLTTFKSARVTFHK